MGQGLSFMCCRQDKERLKKRFYLANTSIRKGLLVIEDGERDTGKGKPI
jgi:hypothetical protein